MNDGLTDTQHLAVSITNVSKSYRSGRRSIRALHNVSLDIGYGDYVSIVGPSGCGKSTLLNIMTGIDSSDTGEVVVLGTSLIGLSQDRLAAWRGREVGIVFQFFQLMPTLTVLENVILPMDLTGNTGSKRERATQLLELVGLENLADNLPSELSGGEQQRVAVARALANNPSLIVADEPTGNLDTVTGEAVISLLESLWRDGTTVILVTHNQNIARRAPRMVGMRDGEIVEDRFAVDAELSHETQRDELYADANTAT